MMIRTYFAPKILQRACLTGLAFLLTAALVAQGDDGQPKTIRIALIGDSTVASYARPPADRPDLTGWGQVLGEFLDARVEVLNFAVSGRSSKSFLRENRWQPVLDAKPDYVFIQFGHNDQPGKGDRATDAGSDFQDNLKRYIHDARQAGAKPVLVTPVARRIFDEEGKPTTTLTPYAEAMRKVGRQTGTPVIDLHQASFDLYARLGDEASRPFSPSDSDRTHFSRKGALAMARLVVEQLPQAAPELKARLKSAEPTKQTQK
jgi:lysophospholipase L1-like esterase